jgi:hypothetical protein
MIGAKYKIATSIAGVILGIVLGLGILSQTKKSQRDKIESYAIIGCAIFGLISGYGIGAKFDKESHIEKELGIDIAVTEFIQNGRFWIASTKWTDAKKNSYILLTGKNSDNDLISQLNDELVYTHQTKSGSRVNVEKFHSLARKEIFNKLKSDLK